MRPVLVLILVLGAVASLVFAIASISDDGGRNTIAAPGLTKPVDAPEIDLGELEAPLDVVREEVRSVPETAESGTRVGARPALTGVIEGRVIGMDEMPIEGANIALVDRPGGTTALSESMALLDDKGPETPVKKTRSDARGNFRFTEVRPGSNWVLVVTHDAFAKNEAGPVRVDGDGVAFELIQLNSGLALRGFVRDADTGMPIEGAAVVIDSMLASYLPSTRTSPMRREVYTDATGAYLLGNIGAGSRSLSITAKGYATQLITSFDSELRTRTNKRKQPDVWATNRARQIAEINAMPNEPVEWDFSLARGKVIAGVVVGPDLDGVKGVLVTAINQNGTVGSRGEAISQANGEFLIEDLGEGIYAVHTQAADFQPAQLLRIDAGRTDVEIQLARHGSVAGRVIDAATGRPVTGFTIRVRSHHPRNVTWGSVVAKQTFRDRKDGSFTIGGVSSTGQNMFVIESFARGYASSFSQPFRVDQGIQANGIEVALTRGGTVRGKVVDAYTNEPIVGAIVKTNDNNFIDSEITLILNSMGQSATSKEEVSTNAEGEFEFALLTPDTYQLRIEKKGYSPLILNDVQVADGPPTLVGPYALKKGAVVSGTVYDPLGVPIPGANITMRPVDTDYFNSTQGRSDGNGHYVLTNAEAGTYLISASRPASSNSNPFAPVMDIQHSEIEITIADGGSYVHDLHLPARQNN